MGGRVREKGHIYTRELVWGKDVRKGVVSFRHPDGDVRERGPY